jgi:hypothetical protein
MQKLIQNKPIAISEYDLVPSLIDWSYIEFDQEFQFDDFPDFTPFLSDTAISPYLSHWYLVFSKDLLNVLPPTFKWIRYCRIMSCAQAVINIHQCNVCCTGEK